jgi:hypothetical protein
VIGAAVSGASCAGWNALSAFSRNGWASVEFVALLRAAGLELLERRPMWPAIPAEPARGRTLWVARGQGC